MLKIAIATETRAEYGLLRPVYHAMAAGGRLEPTFLVSGMHHLKRFGRTVDAIRADGVKMIPLPTARDDDAVRPAGPGLAAARATARYAEALADFDWLVVLGDRVEMLAAALAATAVGRPVAHLHGGDVAPGARDDAVRHAITKLAHLHFAATADAARRLRRLGEPAWRIRLAGAPGIDAIRHRPIVDKGELDRLAGFDTDEPFAVVVQHAAGFSAAQEQRHLRATLDAVAVRFARAVVVGPGLDLGSDRLHETIEGYIGRRRRRLIDWVYAPSLDQAIYFALLERAAVLVGNSSSGIIESGWFGLPVVNVGPRQRGRLCSTNVLHCDYGRAAVAAALERATGEAFVRKAARCRQVYGRGRAGQVVAETLAAAPIDRRLLVKAITY